MIKKSLALLVSGFVFKECCKKAKLLCGRPRFWLATRIGIVAKKTGNKASLSGTNNSPVVTAEKWDLCSNIPRVVCSGALCDRWTNYAPGWAIYADWDLDWWPPKCIQESDGSLFDALSGKFQRLGDNSGCISGQIAPYIDPLYE